MIQEALVPLHLKCRVTLRLKKTENYPSKCHEQTYPAEVLFSSDMAARQTQVIRIIFKASKAEAHSLSQAHVQQVQSWLVFF